MKKVIISAAAAVLVIAVAILVFCTGGKRTLKVTDQDSGKVYLELSAENGDVFSVTYIHSVHQTPVTESYEIREDGIYVVGARFYTFGAGMQTDYPEGVTYTYADDGAIVVTGYNTFCKDLIYCVGKMSDHVLEYNGKEYSLRDICGRGAMVGFTVD